MESFNALLLIILFFLFHIPHLCSHVDTLGAEKESGVPYILTSRVRYRQTPSKKHDEKIRHVGLAHAAQPSYRAFSLTLAKFYTKHTIRCCVRAENLSGFPAPRLWLRCVGDNAPYHVPRFWPLPWKVAATERGPPLALARWQVLCAALCCATASRRAVPADIKDLSPLLSDGTKTVYHNLSP